MPLLALDSERCCARIGGHASLPGGASYDAAEDSLWPGKTILAEAQQVIPALPEQRFPWYVRLLFWIQKRRYGLVSSPTRLWARTPRVFAAFLLLYGALDRRASPLEPTIRSLVMVRVSQINGCAFCVDLNSAMGRERGVDFDKLAALAYAEAVTYTDRQPEPGHFERLRPHFDGEAIVELTALIAFQNLSSKFNTALGVAPQGFCRL